MFERPDYSNYWSSCRNKLFRSRNDAIYETVQTRKLSLQLVTYAAHPVMKQEFNLSAEEQQYIRKSDIRLFADSP